MPRLPTAARSGDDPLRRRSRSWPSAASRRPWRWSPPGTWRSRGAPSFTDREARRACAGACDGCLARVDDVPNVMTCRVPAADGMRIETQNVVGSRDTDLLRVADWFFPEGMNHHELFAGVPGVQQVMQGFARRVAGLGKLPGRSRLPRAGARRGARSTSLVVGSGPAGDGRRLALAARGRQVEVVDDDLALGRQRAGPSGRRRRRLGGQPLDAFGDAVDARRAWRSGCARPRPASTGTTSARPGADERGSIEVVHARTLVLAPGAHDGVLAFEGNDVPGVMSAARPGAGCSTTGVAPGAKRRRGPRRRGRPLRGARSPRADPGGHRRAGPPVRVRGSARVKAVTAGDGRGRAADRVRHAPRRCAAGPRLRAVRPGGRRAARTSRAASWSGRRPGGRIRDGVFAVGEVVGTPARDARGGRARARGARDGRRGAGQRSLTERNDAENRSVLDERAEHRETPADGHGVEDPEENEPVLGARRMSTGCPLRPRRRSRGWPATLETSAGDRSGKSTVASRSSRARVRTVIAPKRVPVAATPTVPRSITSGQRRRRRRAGPRGRGAPRAARRRPRPPG